MLMRYRINAKFFYPRSPCGERPWARGSRVTYVDFLSTLSLRRATLASKENATQQTIFYPRSPCGERHRNIANGERKEHFSIHALLAESDTISQPGCAKPNTFLSTLSLRRATAKVHRTAGHFCAYETNFMGIASSC